jgi:archaemetzincin
MLFELNAWVGQAGAIKRIIIMPIGKVDAEILQSVSSAVANKFHTKTEVGRKRSVPPDSYNALREQYNATAVLKEMMVYKQGSSEILFGIIDADLYASKLNYVFGEADPHAGVAIISLWRLRQEFYAFSPDEELLKERAVKEAIHELGHVFGLDHCSHPKCIMYFSNNIGDTDRKRAEFCDICKNTLGI